VCLAKPGIENATCVRLRLRDTLLYRLPLVVDRFGATATEVQALGIGLVVDPANSLEVAQALEAVAGDARLRSELVGRIEEIRARYLLDKYVAPLVQMVRDQEYAPDRGSAGQEQRLAELLERHPNLEKPPAYPW
jgi:hypothetical protein